ncbi:family 6 putative glycoside hydrolase [Cercophora samala]|uniref:Glucanase n=1 Tax=Cercophora samala TaxID=330535 RepID=A0AA39ZJT7_9PEZI|nr:family 6 putative glycoside hydrolase [Cercophora samala]
MDNGVVHHALFLCFPFGTWRKRIFGRATGSRTPGQDLSLPARCVVPSGPSPTLSMVPARRLLGRRGTSRHPGRCNLANGGSGLAWRTDSEGKPGASERGELPVSPALSLSLPLSSLLLGPTITMRADVLIAALATGALAAAVPTIPKKPTPPKGDVSNPFVGKTQFVNPEWSNKLTQTYKSFLKKGDVKNALRTLQAQKVSTFVWVSRLSELGRIDEAIATARRVQKQTGKKQIVGLVLYNLPDRDCSAGESAGELLSGENGFERYKEEFVKPYAQKVAAAKDLEFAIVLEPDSLGNLVTNLNIPLCAGAVDVYRDGIAHAITQLQQDNVHLYIDAAHGGWLGWNDNLPLAADEFAEVLKRADEASGKKNKIRGFATNVSNYNPLHAVVRENYTEWSNSWDESNYATSLAPHLEERGLPAHFIVDQGRVALPGARKEWGEWCNVAPSGFGPAPSTNTNNTVVDAIVWIKPGGESDGECGYINAPRAGHWHDEFAQQLVENAHPSVYEKWWKFW